MRAFFTTKSANATAAPNAAILELLSMLARDRREATRPPFSWARQMTVLEKYKLDRPAPVMITSDAQHRYYIRVVTELELSDHATADDKKIRQCYRDPDREI